MTPQKVGQPRRGLAKIYLDIQPGREPRAGEWLVSAGLRGYGSAYLIVYVRESSRRPRRFYLTVQRGHELAEAISSPNLWVLRWYKRGGRGADKKRKNGG